MNKTTLVTLRREVSDRRAFALQERAEIDFLERRLQRLRQNVAAYEGYIRALEEDIRIAEGETDG